MSPRAKEQVRITGQLYYQSAEANPLPTYSGSATATLSSPFVKGQQEGQSLLYVPFIAINGLETNATYEVTITSKVASSSASVDRFQLKNLFYGIYRPTGRYHSSPNTVGYPFVVTSPNETLSVSVTVRTLTQSAAEPVHDAIDFITSVVFLKG